MIYLNNAATSYPKPDCVIEAMNDNLRAAPTSAGRENVTCANIFDKLRARLATLFQFEGYEQRIILCSGATEALNIGIQGIIQPNARVVTTVLEHNAVLRPLYELRQRIGISLSFISLHDRRLKVDSLLDAVESAQPPDALVVSAASNVTGEVPDLEKLMRACCERKIPLIIDAAQACPCVNISLHNKPYVAVAVTGHKSLLGASGTGGILLGEALEPRPIKFGGNGILSDIEHMPHQLPLRLEAGTQNAPGCAALCSAIDYINQIENSRMAEHKMHLLAQLEDELVPVSKNIITYSVPAHENPCGTFSFNIRALFATDAGYMLAQSFDIRVRTGLHCAPLVHHALGTFPHGAIRASLSYFTTENEITALANGIKLLSNNENYR